MAGGGATVVRANLRILLRKSLTVQKRALKMRPRFGGVPERPKGSDCKSDAKASQVRILPPPPLIARGHRIVAITSAFQADDAGSIPAARSNLVSMLM